MPETATSRPFRRATPVVSVFLGITFVGICTIESLGWLTPFDAEWLPKLLMALGVALILYGLGYHATLTVDGWLLPRALERWVLAGAGGLVIVLYSVLAQPLQCPPCETSSMTARVNGDPFPENIVTVEVRATDDARLYGFFRRLEKDFNLLIENKHLKRGCLTFVFITKDAQHEFLRVHTSEIKRVHESLTNKTEVVELLYKKDDNNKGNLVHLHDGRENPLSVHRHLCMPRRTTTGRRNPHGITFLPRAFAQVRASLYEDELVALLHDDDPLIRFEAQQSLAMGPPEVISTIVDRLALVDEASVKWPRLAEGAVFVMAAQLARGLPPNTARNQIKAVESLRPFVRMLTRSDQTARNLAATVLLRLHDPRVYRWLVAALKQNTASKDKYYPALVLADIYPKLPATTQQQIIGGSYRLDERTTKLLKGMVMKVGDVDDPVFLPYPNTVGWAYIGIHDGGELETSSFDSLGGKPPKVGDIMETKTTRSLRENVIEYHQRRGWIDAEVVGLLREGSRVRVTDVKNVLKRYYWVQVERIK